MRCEGYRKYGGIMTFGPRKWEQCENVATVLLEVKQNGEQAAFPACPICWQEAIDKGFEIISVKPIVEKGSVE